MSNQSKRLYRSRQNRMISGVCGGIGEFFGIDGTIVRLTFVVGHLRMAHYPAGLPDHDAYCSGGVCWCSRTKRNDQHG